MFEEGHGPDDCDLIDMDEDEFPLDAVDVGDQSQEQRAYDVLKHCFLRGCCPRDRSLLLPHNQRTLYDFLRHCYSEGYCPKPLMTILDFELDANLDMRSNQVQKCLQMFEKHTSAQHVKKIRND